ncbi:Myb/SANT-like DNA-binding domain [Phytophthora infestans]|uniref:Myb/SANT-like DNA-binding domain n=1 Tax=Phytophthora infestans TaxID=4787 RepID=A0A8S9URM2_PHYIN|nr:Myb/SANT-like DNA-binding domain [Phytophthora infestans]
MESKPQQAAKHSGRSRSSSHKARTKDTRDEKGGGSKRGSAKSTSNKSNPDETNEVAQRATWAEIQEFEFLNEFFDARNTPECKTEKGLKTKAWSELVESLNKKHGQILGKEQYMSKLSRMLHIYDLYKHIMKLSGSGIDAGIPTLDDDVWYKLIKSKQTYKSAINKIRKEGFPHATVCSVIAGMLRLPKKRNLTQRFH